MRRFFTVIRTVLLFCLVMLGRSVTAQVGVASYGVAPVETVRLSQPQLAWRVSPNSGMVKEVHITLNGKSVTARYDSDKRTAIGTLDAPLAPGPYDVRCELVMDSGRVYPKLWSFKIASNAVSKIPAVSPSAEIAITLINQIRQKIGLPLYTLDPRLCAAASEYSKALSQQPPGDADHAPELPSLVKSYCYPGQCFESVGLGFNPVKTMVKSFFDGPYHRAAFIQPGNCDVGVGVHGDANRGYVVTLLFSLSDESAVVVYPRDGQNDVPLDWDAQEDTNNPLKVHGFTVVQTKVGYPITLFAVGPYGARLGSVKATLATDSGTAVPFYLNTPDNDKDNLDNGVVLIPKQALKPGTTYVVSVTAQNEHEEPVEQTWKFTTAGKKKP